ncbi:MAG: cytochrome c [Phycisphaerales bacterium]|nr:cytochrome c [Phycisphaerales bacterium]
MLELATVLVVHAAGFTPEWKDVAPIIASQCATCHSPGGEAPFRLDRASDFAARRTFSAAVIEQDLMPPWLPGQDGIPIHGRGPLSSKDKEALLAWLNAGAPHPKGAAVRPDVVTSSDDAVTFALEEGFDIPAESEITLHAHAHNVRTFAIPLVNDEPLFVRGLRWVTPLNNAIHGVAVSADPTGQAEVADELESPAGYHMSGDVGSVPSGSMGMLGVGARAFTLPEGFGFRVPIGSAIVTEVAYRPVGRELPLTGSLELELAHPEDELRPLESVMIMKPWMKLAAGERRKEVAELIIPFDIEVVAMTPRGDHYLRSMSLEAIGLEGERRLLVSYPDWDPHWASTELLVEPLVLQAGTRLELELNVDNSDDNPRNLKYPAEDLTLGRFTGVDGIMLHAAAVNPDEEEDFQLWQQMRRR